MSWKRQEKTISPFDVVPNRLVCFQPDWITHGMSPQANPWAPLSTKNTLKHIYIPQDNPTHSYSLPRLHQAQRDANRHFQTTEDSFLHIRLSQSGAKPPMWQNLERRDCFLLTLSRHQNIKTSQCTISKNGWVLPFCVILTPVTKKLQFTVFLDHPVSAFHQHVKRNFKRASQEWQDINLKWNKSDYGQIGDIRIPPKYIWKPDLLMYNRSVWETSIFSFANSLFPVLTKLLTGRITRMWLLQVRECALTSRPESSSPPARSTSPGSPLTTRTATWSSGAGRTTASRSTSSWRRRPGTWARTPTMGSGIF